MDDNQLEVLQSDGRIDEKSAGVFRICLRSRLHG